MPVLSGTPYQELLEAIANYYGSGSDPWVEVAKYGSSADDFVEIVNQLPGYEVVTNKAGDVITYQKIGSFPTTNPATVVDSNVVNPPVKVTTPATVVQNPTTGEVIAGKGITTPNAFQFITKSVVPAIVATGVAITLGKTIDKTLYNLNPDFWDAAGLGTLNPDTWSTITTDMSDSTGEKLLATAFNLLYGIDPATNTSQAYIDQNALAYLALYMQMNGFFDSAHLDPYVGPLPTEISRDLTGVFDAGSLIKVANPYPGVSEYSFDLTIPANCRAIVTKVAPDSINVRIVSKSPFTGSYTTTYRNEQITTHTYTSNSCTYNGETLYYTFITHPYILYNGSLASFNVSNIHLTSDYTNLSSFNSTDNNLYSWSYAKAILDSSIIEPLPGVGNQDEAKLPDFAGITTLAAMLAALQAQYPELFNNAVDYSVMQPDGTEVVYKYIPIALPDATSATDTQPTADGETITQQQPAYDPATMPEEIWEAIWDIIMPSPTEEDTPTDTTGEGDTPPIVPPVGTASALWKIYNPSQTQLDDFGAWLWSSDFVDQLLKVFSDPMQAIIGLHKIFVTPPVSGSGPIKVGYLVSDASANYVSGQYVDVPCGSVTLSEYFHNVFDYENTQVSIYLPFSGIHKLDVDDVMRGEISVVYHVDVLTGACLIDISVKRDMVGGVLYTFNGNCAVQYPVSSGSYVGIVTGLLGIVGGVAGTIATGGALAPMLMGAGASIGHMHTDVQHSGNISSNAGAMGGKIPYLIIERPQIKTPPSGSVIEGLPQNEVVSVSSLQGFVRIKSAHYDGIPATSEELSMIRNLLESGVYIN